MIKRILRLFLSFFLILIVILLFYLQIGASFSKEESSNEYMNVQSSSITNLDTKITKIAMLGAHDAFTNGICHSSNPNPNESGLITNKAIDILGKGLVTRLSKAQMESALSMLNSGVRYFDVRITNTKDGYYTTHGYLSYELSYYLKDVLSFLEKNPGEFIILDIQDFYSDGKKNNCTDIEYQSLFTYMDTITGVNGSKLTDYIYYDSKIDALSSITYGKITKNKTKGGILMLAKTNSSSLVYTRDGNATKELSDTIIRSYWHNTNDTTELLHGINEEYELLKQNPQEDILVVNQAQKTGFLTNTKILSSLFQWSLLDMADNMNSIYASDEETFKKWLSVMPIFMVDHATTNNGNFNSNANRWIKEYNNAL